MPTSSSRPRLFVIWLTVFIDLMGFGIVMPILPYYAQRFGAHGVGDGHLRAVPGRISHRVQVRRARPNG